uniref:Uncharacterized protein n=1 Tax=Proboscia inermis TaxID=420281 RepID=A0A7S0GGD7_9STRA
MGDREYRQMLQQFQRDISLAGRTVPDHATGRRALEDGIPNVCRCNPHRQAIDHIPHLHGGPIGASQHLFASQKPRVCVTWYLPLRQERERTGDSAGTRNALELGQVYCTHLFLTSLS